MEIFKPVQKFPWYPMCQMSEDSSLGSVVNNEEHCHVAYDSKQLQFIGSFTFPTDSGGFCFCGILNHAEMKNSSWLMKCPTSLRFAAWPEARFCSTRHLLPHSLKSIRFIIGRWRFLWDQTQSLLVRIYEERRCTMHAHLPTNLCVAQWDEWQTSSRHTSLHSKMFISCKYFRTLKSKRYLNWVYVSSS